MVMRAARAVTASTRSPGDTGGQDYADEISTGTAPTSKNTLAGHITPPST
jgi:hypothetical protein